MGKQSGFGAILIFLLILFAAAACVIGWSLWGSQTKDTVNSALITNNYDDCVLAGGYLSNSRAVLAPELGFSCEIDKVTYNAAFERCYAGKCKDIDAAFQNYCYKINSNKINSLSGAIDSVSYYRSTIIKEGFARGSIYCHNPKSNNTAEDTLLTVYLQHQDDSWRHYFTMTSTSTCVEIDGKGMPLSIAGICYEPNVGWRTPVN